MQKKLHIKLGKKTIYTCTWRSVLYMLCFFLLCVIDQRIKSCTGLDGWLETFRNLTGAAVAVLILSHYRWSDFTAHRAPYLALAGISAVGSAAALIYGYRNAVFFNAFCVLVLDVVLFCFIVMHTFIALVLEKKRPALKKSFLKLWAVMMLWMIGSRSDYVWPFCYFIIFGCFYLTDFTEDEQRDMLQGMLNGIILGFFVLQGFCLMFRPYDNVRYLGAYSNPNMNSLFYVEVLAAVLGKILYVHREKTGKAVKGFYWLGSGVVLAFIFMTIGRSAWVTAFLVVLTALWALKKTVQKKRFWRHMGLMLLCTCLMFPVCFSLVRYVPPLFHHTVWFWGEYHEDKVHSYDPWNSWKYVELDEFMYEAVGRVAGSFQNLWNYVGLSETGGAAAGELSAEESVVLPASELSAEGSVELLAGELSAEGSAGLPAGEGLVLLSEEKEGADAASLPDEEAGSADASKKAVLPAGSEADSFLTRKTIYAYYIRHLNFWGHPYEEQGFQLTPTYHIGHAHNIFLQFGTDFGIPVMVMFLAAVVWGALRLRSSFLEGLKVEKAAALLYLLIPAVFGMFEYAWGTGSLSLTMMFLAWGSALRE